MDKNDFLEEQHSGNSNSVEDTSEVIIDRKNRITAIIILTIIIALLLLFVLLFVFKNNPVDQCINQYENGTVQMATQIYNETIKGDSNLEKEFKEKTNGLFNEIKNNYYSETISYETAIQKIDSFKEIKDIKDEYNHILAEINALKNSRDAYIKALECQKLEQYIQAVDLYSSVIATDSNYNYAKETISELESKYLQELEGKITEYINNKDFSSAKDILSNSIKIYSNNTDIKEMFIEIENQKNEYEKQKKEERIEQLKNQQKISVLSAYAYDEGNYIILRRATVSIKNNTDQVMKECTIGILQFDNNGYPVEVRTTLYGEDNLYNCKMDSANVLPGKTYGSGYYWDIADKATKIKACVKSAEFYDGTVWYNEYFDYWLEQEKDRF